MSWLYSILLAGLMYSTDTPVTVPIQNTDIQPAPAAVGKLDETERFEQTYPLNPNGRVSVSNVNGSISIDTWDRNEVKLVAVKTADTRERLAEVQIAVDSKSDYFSVETDYGDWKRNNRNWKNNGRLEVEYTLTVPRNASLSEIETVNGSVKINNAGGVVKASAVNGEVRATNLRGATNLSSVNGLVEAYLDQLQTGSRISLGTVNGTVKLTIPSDANATLRADSLNGDITNDFGLPVRKGKYIGRDLYGKVGTGEVQIKLNSVNGDLSIKRKADGKNTNPAENLLPQKSEDDEDWDEDSESARVNRVKIAKEAAKAMKDAQKEIDKIKPEMEKAAKEIKESAAVMKQTEEYFKSEEFKKTMREARIKQDEMRAKIAEIGWVAGAPVVESKSGNFVVKGVPRVTVDAMNCDVTVRGWDKNEVKYSITKVSKIRSAAALDLKTVNTDSDVNIKIANPDTSSYKDFYNRDISRVTVEVYVPKKSNLKIVTNREIRLESVSGDLDITGSEGAINVRDSDGKLRVNSDCGTVRVIGFRGTVDSTTVSGNVSLEGEFSMVSGASREGNIILTIPEAVNAEIVSNAETVTVENMPVPKKLGEGNWRFGNGGAKYNLTVETGQIVVRSANALKAE